MPRNCNHKSSQLRGESHKLFPFLKILFSTFGSLGDIHPYLALSLEAKKRGHSPIIATSERYRAKIEAQNVEFRAISPDIPPEEEFAPLARRVMNERDGPRFLFENILAPAIDAQYADMLRACEDANVVVTHPAVMTGPLVARKLGKKWMSSVLSPISLWSRRDPAVVPTLPQLDFLRVFGTLWGTVQVLTGRIATKRWVAPIQQLAAREGIATSGHPMFGGQYSPHGTLALFSRHFCAPQPDWPFNTTATGFCFYDAVGWNRNDEGIDWRAWMEEGPAPFVFGLGSAAVHDGDFVWDAAVRAAKRDNARVVLLTAGNFETNEKNILCVPYAPYSEIFPLAGRIFHQGGVGTTAQALRSGVPQTVIPFAHDQSDNAGRVKRLGIGSWLSRNKVDSLSLKLDAALEAGQKERAREIGERIRAENGALAACEALERCWGN